MQYILSQEEYKKLVNSASDALRQEYAANKLKIIVASLRKKVMEDAKFTCFHDLPETGKYSEVYVDEGYCDSCPLSFCQNEKREGNYQLCPQTSHLYSK